MLGRGQLGHAMLFFLKSKMNGGGVLFALRSMFVLRASRQFAPHSYYPAPFRKWSEFMKYIPYINIDKCLGVRPVYFLGGRGLQMSSLDLKNQ